MTYNFKCDKCSFSSDSKYDVSEHIRRVHDHLKCGNCNYSTVSLENLLVHKRVSHMININLETNHGAKEEISNIKEGVNDQTSIVHEEIGFTSPKRNGVDDNIKLEQGNTSKYSNEESVSTSHKQQQCYDRPPFSYKQLIAQALMTEKATGLLLRDIYSFINKKYPFYKMNDPGWQNSIRHNLSLHRGFENVPSGECHTNKVGKGSWWRIKGGFEDRVLKRGKKQYKVYQKDPFKEVDENGPCEINSTLVTSQNLRGVHKIEPVYADTRDFVCQKCDFVAYKQGNLDNHIRQVHEQIAHFKCMWCTYSTTRRTILANHIKSYHKEK